MSVYSNNDHRKTSQLGKFYVDTPAYCETLTHWVFFLTCWHPNHQPVFLTKQFWCLNLNQTFCENQSKQCLKVKLKNGSRCESDSRLLVKSWFCLFTLIFFLLLHCTGKAMAWFTAVIFIPSSVSLVALVLHSHLLALKTALAPTQTTSRLSQFGSFFLNISILSPLSQHYDCLLILHSPWLYSNFAVILQTVFQ